jgi:transposase
LKPRLTQRRLMDFSAASTDTRTLPVPGSISQRRVVPGAAPKIAAIASGIVARTEGDPGTVWRTLDRNVPTMHAPRGSMHEGVCIVGYHIRQPIDYRYKYWGDLCVSQYGGQYRVRKTMRAGIEIQMAGDERMVRGREIASHPETIEKLGSVEWSVPSQSGFGRYRVWFVEREGRCTCPDYSKHATPCKHIFAVMDLRLKEAGRPMTVPAATPRKQYAQHPTYTKGQTGEMRLLDSLLRELVSEVPDFPRAPGLPGPAPTPFRDELYCAVLKVYSGMSGRRACGVYQNVADRGLLTRAPSFAVASNLLTRPEATAVLYHLLRMSALPLAGLEDGGAVAPDSTGVQTTSFGGWREEKHGEKRQKKWLKVHAMVGTKTHVVIGAVVSETNSGDSPQFEPLLRGALEDGFRPGTVVADKGYLSRDNYTLAADLGIGAYIPFKSNSIASAQGSSAWKRAYHLFQANREEFDRNYHRRSNVESVFSALKRKFGENIRSRTEVAQVNEVLCKLIAYNLTVVVHEMFENGIAPSFASPATIA